MRTPNSLGRDLLEKPPEIRRISATILSTSQDNAHHIDDAYILNVTNITAGGLPGDMPRFRAGGEHRGSRHRALGITLINTQL